tara:strand:+ start:3454 stop:4029 length:576 start_codon:yes stop_codon:yes gene_type:complete
MMDLKNVKSVLNAFGKTVVLNSKNNLKSKGNLEKSITFSEVEANKNSIAIQFIMEEYGLYQDKGVKGAINPYTGANAAKEYKQGVTYQFGTGSGTGRGGGLRKSIEKWVEKKRFQFQVRNKKGKIGQFMSYKATASLISRSIWSKGIKPTLFFTKPFEKAYKKLPKEIEQVFGLDVASFMEFTLKDLKNKK